MPTLDDIAAKYAGGAPSPTADPLDEIAAKTLSYYQQAQQDGPVKQVTIGKEGFADSLRSVLGNTDWGTRNIAGAGTALSNLWEGAKQFVGKGDQQRIEANKIIESEAPIGSIAGNIALTAAPFAAAGNSLKAAGAVGAGYGALQPVQGEQSLENVAKGKAINSAIGGGLGVAGQAVANKAGDWLAKKAADLAARKAANSVKDATLHEALDAGYRVPASMMPDSGATARVLEGVSGKYKTNQLAGIKNQQVTDSIVRKSMGMADDAPITSEAMQNIRNTAFRSGYEPVASVGQIKTDDVYKKAMDSIVDKYQGASRSFPGAASDDVTNAILGQSVGGSPGKTLFVDGAGRIVQDVKIPQEPKLRSLLHELKQSGGISNKELADLGVEKVSQSYPGLIRNNGGKSMDDVVEWLEQHQWIDASQVKWADDNMPGGSHELAREMLRDALGKNPAIHPLDEPAVYAYRDALKNLDEQGIRVVKIPGADPTIKGGLKVDSFDAGDAIKMTQILRDEASTAYASGNKALGKAKKEAAKAIEDQIERGLFSMGADGSKLLGGFRDARKTMAKAHDVEDAIREGAGMVDAKAFARKFQKGAPLSDGLDTIGKFANVFGDVAGIPKSGHANPLTALDFMQMSGTGPLGMIATGNPFGALGAVALPAARIGARYGLLSDVMQHSMARPDYAIGTFPRVAGGLLQYSPVGATALGMPALAQ